VLAVVAKPSPKLADCDILRVLVRLTITRALEADPMAMAAESSPSLVLLVAGEVSNMAIAGLMTRAASVVTV
jgi:hypothetical protein